MFIDYAFKAEVLRSDIPKLANQISKAIYADYVLRTDGEIIKTNMDLDTALQKRCFLLAHYPKEYAEAEKINLARYKRVGRLKKRIKSILLEGNAVFLTLTFRDDVLSSTSPQTRRQYVRKYLITQSNNYVANIDFGAKNGREHYHAVVSGDCDLSLWNEKCGFALAESVARRTNSKKIPKRYAHLNGEALKAKLQEDNEKALSKYVAKLTNHAIKETTKRSVCIYSAPKKAHIPNKPKLILLDDDILDPFT